MTTRAGSPPTDTRLGEIIALLGTPMADSTDANRRLATVEALLGDIVGDAGLEASAAARLLSLRGELSSHLSAASTLRGLNLGDRAAIVLDRAVEAVRSGLTYLHSLEVTCATRQ